VHKLALQMSLGIISRVIKLQPAKKRGRKRKVGPALSKEDENYEVRPKS